MRGISSLSPSIFLICAFKAAFSGDPGAKLNTGSLEGQGTFTTPSISHSSFVFVLRIFHYTPKKTLLHPVKRTPFARWRKF
jgi:hypothetical protein